MVQMDETEKTYRQGIKWLETGFRKGLEDFLANGKPGTVIEARNIMKIKHLGDRAAQVFFYGSGETMTIRLPERAKDKP